ncbi:MAG: agmatinase [Rhodospirillales bacterium]|nr:agmatinase [Rhodospirillales bacterium]
MPSTDGFLGLGPEDGATYAEARSVVVPFGLEASVTYNGGTAKGPAAMIEASHQVELFDEDLWCEPFRDWGVVTLCEPSIVTGGLADAVGQVAGITGAILDDGKFPLVFGGEHSVTPGAIRPFLERFDDLLVLHFDAHADLRDGYEGEHWSHAAALRRVMDHPTVELVSLGIRNISLSETHFLEANRERISIYWAKDKKDWDVEEIISRLKGRTIYLTFDLDGFDSSLMPATGTPEPGGLFWDDVIPIIKGAGKAGTIVGADICELAPIKDFPASSFLAAKLAYKILSYALG